MGDAVLVKGPRLTGIETVSNDLIGAMAPNRFIVDLGAIQENVARIRRLVGPSTAILAMVKALAYGSDAVRLSTAMQGFGIDAFGVSSVDEGIQLRAAGITREILVMLCTPGETDKLARHRLTPVIYSFEILESIANSARKAGKVLNVHIKIDTGMGRTGALPEEALAMADAVSATGTLRVAGVMTHFACADDKNEDAFSIRQIDTFNDALNTLASHGYSNIVRHAAATAAALRFPCARLDMVRIGIGLYGIFPSEDVRECLDLALAVALVSRISRIQSHKRGDRIGYGGTYIVDRDDFRAAVVPMGYHDGAPRSISNVGYTLVNGRKAPIVGRISMDSMIVDVTSIPEASEGTEVLLHGNYNGYELRPEEVAASIDTIPYELLVRIGPRVQRVFIGT
jgi:alanine racemase/UDP-N-acetylmuramoyl-tripeptide--D-alanyl-D-alanine ligase